MITLSVLFFAGLVVRHVQKQQVPPLQPDSLVKKTSAPAKLTSRQEADASSTAPSSDNPLNLNRASDEELQALDGIGPALSDRIVDYRSTQRPFQRVRELRRVKGIGPATLEDLRDVVVVDAESE